VAASLGTLTLDLIARIGGFTNPLDQARRDAQRNTGEIRKSFVALASGVGAAIGTLPALFAAVAISTAKSAAEISKLAQVSGLSTTQFQKLSAGAATVGIEQDKLSDIFKDVNDKVGDFLNTGAGPLADFFTNIAPKVGVTADQFKKLNSADALQLYVTSLQKANASQAEMTFYMEAIANDATALVPLLRDNGKGFKDFGSAAEAAGVILSDQTIAAAKSFNTEMVTLGQYTTQAKTVLAAEFLPVVAQFSKDIVQASKDGGGLNKIIGELGEKAVTAAAFVVNAGDGVTRVFGIISNTLVGTYATAVGYLSDIAAKGSSLLSNLPGDTGKEYAAEAKKYADDAKVNFAVAAEAAAEIKNNLEMPLAGDKFKEYVANAKKAAADLAAQTPSNIIGGTGTGVDPEAIKAAAAAAKAAEAAAKASRKQGEDAITDYKRQIELIDESTGARAKATEASKVAFDIESGKLKDISAEQKVRLLDLAKELDAKKAIQKTNEENVRIAAYEATLRDENQTVSDSFDMEFAGAGTGDKLKERLKSDLAIQQDYENKRKKLYDEFKESSLAGDPEAEKRYKTETSRLEEALATRTILQEGYYARQDELQKDWLAGVGDAWANYKDIATDYNQQAADATSGLLGDTTSTIAESLEGLALKTMTVGEAFVNLGTTMASSVLKSLSDIAAQWLVTQAIQLLGIDLLTTKTVAAEGIKTAAKVTADGIATASSLTATATTTTAQVTAATTTLSAWLPAALVASIGSFGAAAVVGGAALVAAFALIKGFEDGGYTGDGASDAVAGIVHKGEYVFTKAQTQAIGVGRLAQIAANGYEDGGLVTIPGLKTEGVTNIQTAARLDKAVDSYGGDRGYTVNLIEDASKAGKTQMRDEDDQRILDIFVSDLYSDGKTKDAMSNKFGLKGIGS